MAFLKNFIIAVIIIGILTRLSNYFYAKKIKRELAIYFTFFTVGIVTLPILSLILGFDVAVSEYVVALIIWLLFDLMRIGVNFKRKK